MPRLDVGGVEAETFGSAEVIFRVVEKDGFVGHDAECAYCVFENLSRRLQGFGLERHGYAIEIGVDCLAVFFEFAGNLRVPHHGVGVA